MYQVLTYVPSINKTEDAVNVTYVPSINSTEDTLNVTYVPSINPVIHCNNWDRILHCCGQKWPMQ